MQLAGASVPPKDHDAALVVLREAVACGVNHIDTSDLYGAGTFSVIEIWRPANCQPTEIRFVHVEHHAIGATPSHEGRANRQQHSKDDSQ